VHQDVKPTNILVTTKKHPSSIYDSSFGLADLGTSSLIEAGSTRAARDNFGTKTYGKKNTYRASVPI
jgi:serine/threonine protein kinase